MSVTAWSRLGLYRLLFMTGLKDLSVTEFLILNVNSSLCLELRARE